MKSSSERCLQSIWNLIESCYMSRVEIEELEAKWEKQVNRLIELEFHKRLRMSRGRYKDDIPGFIPQPDAYKGQYDIPLVIDPQLSLPDQHKLAGVIERTDTLAIENLTPVPGKPYTIWTHDAYRYRRVSVRKAITLFKPDEAGSPLVEVTALYLQRPDIFRDHGVDAAGSRNADGYVPGLSTFDGEPEVLAYWDGYPAYHWGALSRGRQINTSGHFQKR